MALAVAASKRISMKAADLFIAALLLTPLAAMAAPEVAACAPSGATRTDSQSACRPTGRPDAQRYSVDSDSHIPPKGDTSRPPNATNDTDADDDDEDTCITKAANGVCLDEDED